MQYIKKTPSPAKYICLFISMENSSSSAEYQQHKSGIEYMPKLITLILLNKSHAQIYCSFTFILICIIYLTEKRVKHANVHENLMPCITKNGFQSVIG